MQMPRKSREIQPPSGGVKDKQDEKFSGFDFDRALRKVTRRLDRAADSERDPGSPKTSG
jgi:hypothetical protein